MPKPASLPCISDPVPMRDILPSPFPHYPLTESPRRRSNPSSLGLFAFAVTTLVSAVQCIIWPLDSRNTMAGVAFIYGGAVQFIVGFMEHAAGNNFSGATFASFGSMWLARAVCMMSNITATSTITDNGFHTKDGMPVVTTSTSSQGIYNTSDARLRHSIAAIDGAFTLVAVTLTLIAALVLRNGSRLLTLTLGSVCIVGALGTVTGCIDQYHDHARFIVTRVNGCCMIVVAALAWYGAINELCLEEGVNLPVGAHSRSAIHHHHHARDEESGMSLPPTIGDFSARSSKDM